MQKGQISVQTENIFPIIKKFLYSDQEIFLRELVSNAVDATTKLEKLAMKGVAKGEIGDTTIEIIVDKEAGTLTISDQGIGMTEDEVQRYLNQVAFSSAQEFLEKYQDDAGIIGHFGLGFYSAFMVASKVEVHTLSYQEGAEGVIWSCDGSPEYTIDAKAKDRRGTDVILYITEEDKSYLEEAKIQELLNKYGRFLPVQIKFGTKEETIYEGEGEEQEAKTITVDNIINNPNPLWKKQPSELTDEDYLAFYKELYPFSQPPMFWIHLNIDYPFNLTGVLYFPKVTNGMELQKNKIQLYSNQVFITDDVSQIVPEFLTLLHGVIDSPDIPLNVSRSYLQSDSNVKKISGHITKKVADKLNSLYKKERENYEEKWSDLSVFVKYGMVSDDKFYEKAKDFVLLKNVDGQLSSIEEYKEKVKDNQTNKDGKLIMLYTNDLQSHDSFIQSARNRDYDVLEMDNIIDNHFMQQLEYKLNEFNFVRVDSDTIDKLIEKDEEIESVLTEKEQEKVKELFESQITGDGTIQLKALSPNDLPVLITKPEFMRRMKEMQQLQGMGMGSMPDMHNIVVNTNHPLVAQKLLKMRSADKKEEFVGHLYNLARLNQGMLQGSELTNFIQKSVDFLQEK